MESDDPKNEVKQLKSNVVVPYGKPISELRSVTCRMGSRSNLSPDTGERMPSRLNPSQIGPVLV